MLRTERKTDQAKQSEKQARQTQQKQSREVSAECAQTLQAILAGGSWEQLPAERIQELSHTLGNAALLELLALRETPPELATRPLPAGGTGTAPAELSRVGQPELVPAPDFASMAPLGGTAPLVL